MMRFFLRVTQSKVSSNFLSPYKKVGFRVEDVFKIKKKKKKQLVGGCFQRRL
jgi:transposase